VERPHVTLIESRAMREGASVRRHLINNDGGNLQGSLLYRFAFGELQIKSSSPL
jgi:hypothetical protein